MDDKPVEYCFHIEQKQALGSHGHRIVLGGGRSMVLCELCWQATRAKVYDSVVRVAAQALAAEQIPRQGGGA